MSFPLPLPNAPTGHHRSGRKTSHPSKPFISPSSSNKLLPPFLPLPLKPVPVRGGSAGGLSSPSIRFGTGFLAPTLPAVAILLLGSGSSRYPCGGGVALEPLALLNNEGFLLGIGGGAGLRRTCGWGLLFTGTAGPGSEDVTGGRLRFGRMGSERVDAFDALRRRSVIGSRAPSM
jgi:hypothetical protein